MIVTSCKLANLHAIETADLSFPSGFNLNAVRLGTHTMDEKWGFGRIGEEPE